MGLFGFLGDAAKAVGGAVVKVASVPVSIGAALGIPGVTQANTVFNAAKSLFGGGGGGGQAAAGAAPYPSGSIEWYVWAAYQEKGVTPARETVTTFVAEIRQGGFGAFQRPFEARYGAISPNLLPVSPTAQATVPQLATTGATIGAPAGGLNPLLLLGIGGVVLVAAVLLTRG